jgi:DNA-directed RNA polymerase subunit E"
MAVKIKACKNCRFLHEEDKCPRCGSTSNTDNWKGRIEIISPENSEIAKELKLKEKGLYTIKSD